VSVTTNQNDQQACHCAVCAEIHAARFVAESPEARTPSNNTNRTSAGASTVSPKARKRFD
jgi:hypothetical protein